MNTKLIRAFLALGIFFACGQASAIPVLMQYIVIFSNSGDTLGAGLSIDAMTTDTSRLIIAGGFTIRCSYSSLQIDAENHSLLTGFTQVRFVVKVPGPPALSPSSYPVLGYSQIPAASCADCTMTHHWEARDETTLSASVRASAAAAAHHPQNSYAPRSSAATR
jgi:hypothetical protein